MRNRVLTLAALALSLSSIGFGQHPGPGPRRPRPGGPEMGRPQLEQLPPIIRRALAESRKHRYAGTRVVEVQGRRAGRERFKEIVWKNGTQLRVERLDNGTIVVENGRKRQIFNPSQNEIVESRAQREETWDRLIQAVAFAANQKDGILIEPGESVAGQKTERVTILDPAKNPLQRLWIDSKSALILKRVLYDRVGAVLGSMEFTEIDYAPRFKDGDFEIRRAGAKVVTPMELARRYARENGFLPVFLPEGDRFDVEGSRVVGRPDSAERALLVHYATPKGVLTLVQAKGELNREMLRRMSGPRNAVHVWQFKNRNFALIGQLTADELKTLAQKTQER